MAVRKLLNITGMVSSYCLHDRIYVDTKKQAYIAAQRLPRPQLLAFGRSRSHLIHATPSKGSFLMHRRRGPCMQHCPLYHITIKIQTVQCVSVFEPNVEAIYHAADSGWEPGVVPQRSICRKLNLTQELSTDCCLAGLTRK